jgi:V8-like Glu-specific endopeptidase
MSVLGLVCAPAVAQPGRVESHVVDLVIDSGVVRNDGGEAAVLFSTVVAIPGGAWLRLSFGEVVLSGDSAADGSYLRIWSLSDGSVQRLNGESVSQWGNTSAYFNGDAVGVELVSYPGTGDNRLVLVSVTVGDAPMDPGVADDLCGADDRVLSTDVRVARHQVGCTAYLIDDLNRQFLTAGHCETTGAHVMSFNVPLSSPSGAIKFPPPSDQYAAEPASVQGAGGLPGADWRYFGVFPNSTTGLQPFQKQGESFVKGFAPTDGLGQLLRVTGYGETVPPVSLEWNKVLKTGTGPMTSLSGTVLRYEVDTSSWNSGSPVIQELTGNVIGIHTHAGCQIGGNYGTALQNIALQNALANPKGVCRTGSGSAGPPMFAIGDSANNFGAVNASSGEFGKISQDPAGAFWQGLTFDANRHVFFAINTARQLWTITPYDGVHVLLGTVQGDMLTLNGLAHDPVQQKLYGISQSDGQLYVIDPNTLASTPIGAPGGGTVGGIEFDVKARMLYGVDDAPGGTQLIRIDTETGAHTTIGALGSGLKDCNGLAYLYEDSSLYTIDADIRGLWKVNKTTGAAEYIGPTFGTFGSAFGMGAIVPPPVPCPADLWPDGVVNQQDLGVLLSGYGCAPPTQGCVGDVDGDGDADQEDLGLLLSAYGQACP